MLQIRRYNRKPIIKEFESIIEIKDVKKNYLMGDVTVTALNKVNLSINEGEIVSIVGVSGSGKTTLLNLIGALDYADSGSIYVEGYDLSKLSDRELSYLRRETIGYVFQQFNLLEELTAAKNVELPMILAKKPKSYRKKRVKELLETVGLGDRANHKPDQLSGGEQQRVAIARALANKPKIILADEPTGNLDSHTGEKIIKLLLEISKEKQKTLIYVTHNKEQAKMATRQITMNDGKITDDVWKNKNTNRK
ncbi:MAG: ABC transporter ATP-binding protein [Candidatus Heimdallarchaeaceae archaeon]